MRLFPLIFLLVLLFLAVTGHSTGRSGTGPDNRRGNVSGHGGHAACAQTPGCTDACILRG